MHKLITFATNAFPLWIILCSGMALVEPAIFTWFSGAFITYGLGVIMLGMGMTLKPEDFKLILRSPKWVFAGAALQFTVMPVLGWGLGFVFDLPAPFAVGLIIVSCCPGGTASNVISYMAKANVALSVTMTAVSTLLAIALTPLLTTFLIGNKIEVSAFQLFLGTIKVVLVPVLLGISMNRYLPKLTHKLSPVAPLIAVVAIVLIVASIIGQGKNEILNSGLKLIGAVVTLHLTGFLMGYLLSKLVTNRKDVNQTISIEVGMQNSGLGAYLARANFANPAIAIPSAISSATHSIIGSIAAGIWRNKNKHMKTRLLLLLILGTLILSSCTYNNSPNEIQKPNFLFILMDDLGWPAISSYGNKHVNTKNIDRLANEGMRFTNAYVTPQCTPTRAVIMTGQHTANNRMWHVVGKYYFPYQYLKEPEYLENLPRETFTLPKALKKQGYRTAIFGKWHLNVYGPDGYYTRLFEENAHHYGFDEVDPMTDPSEYQRYTDKGVDFLTNQTIAFMERNRDNPFFVYLSHHTIHGPIMAPDSLVQKYLDLGCPEKGVNHAEYLASIEHFDNSIGRLLDKLDVLGLAENTVVIFTSDNGGVDTYFDNSPLRYGKGSPYEGGIRVPFIVRWPDAIASGKVNDTPIHAIDFYPTMVELAGGDAEQYDFLDGLSLQTLLFGTGGLERDVLHWYMPLYDHLTYSVWATTPAAVIRKGDYKLLKFFGDYTDISDGTEKHVVGKRLELYDLSVDIGEQHDLSRSRHELAEELETQLDTWIASTGAGLPSLNEQYNPDSLWIRGK